jgi:hypothetical protein
VEKQLRQFGPFVALLVAAVLVVIADPGKQPSNEGATVQGVTATRGTTPGATTAATLPTDAAASSGTEPFAVSGSAPSGAYDSGSSSSGFSSSSSSFASTSSSSSGSFSSSTDSSSDTPAFATTAPDDTTTTTIAPGSDSSTPDSPAAAGSNFYLFDSLASSAACTVGGATDKPLSLAPAYRQSVLNSEPSVPERAAGLALNKADPDSERYLFRTHSLASNSAVSVTDLANGNATRILSQRSDWERLDGIVFTPAKSLLVGENVKVAEKPDTLASPALPAETKAGLVYELNMTTGVPTVRPALGSKAHKGMSFDHLGNLYSVSATNPGYVYRFVPTAANNYSAGTLSALWAGPNGESSWLMLNQTRGRTDADAPARQAGATPYSAPVDAEVIKITSPTGAKRSQLFVAETGANRVITVVLRGSDNTAFSSVYVAPGVNAPQDFRAPSDIAIDVEYNLYISERNGGGAVETSKTEGDDIWVAPANPGSAIQSLPVGRLASLTDCDAEPAGLHFDLTTSKLFLDLKHRGWDGRDMTMLITSSGGL